MSNITTKLNLAGLKHTTKMMKGQSGEVKVLIIPIEQNNLYQGEKGCYLDLTHMELKNPREGSKDTHLVKQNLPKEVYAAMSDEEKMSIPILGNSIVWGESSSNFNEPVLAPPMGEDDDLPF